MDELIRTTDAAMVESSESQAIVVSPSSLAERDGLLLILWRRRWIVLACVAVALAGALVYLRYAQPLYTSTARLYVQQAGPQLLTTNNQQPVPRDDNYLFTQAEFLRAGPIISPVVERPEIRSMQSLRGEPDLVTFLKNELDVTIGKKDQLISVSLDGPDRVEVAQLVNAIVNSYIAYNSGENRSTAMELVEVLRAEKDKRDAELAAKSKALFEYKIANGTLSFESDNGNVVVQRLAKLSDALTEAELEVVNTKSNFEAAKAVGLSAAKMRRLIEAQHIATGGVGETGSEAEERESRADLSRMEMQLALMSEKYAERHPMVRSLMAGIEQRRAGIERRDREFCEAYLAAAETAWRTAEQRSSEIRTQMDAQQKQALELNAKAAEFTRLQSERNRVEKLCDALDARISELDLSHQAGAPLDIRVLEPALPARKPSKPHRLATLGVALALGLMLGIALGLVREFRDGRLHSADDIHLMLQLPLLGVVPHMSNRTPRMQKGQAVHLQPMSTVAEAYRTLRTAVHFGGRAAGGAKKAKTILVTSPAPGDGKSTAASNLAIAMAQGGRKVLLLDADCRKPAQHLVFGLDGAPGLCGLLSGDTPPDEAIRPSGIENLDILPCGRIPPNPSEILSSDLFAQVLSALRYRYDQVVIDSPPLGAVTDAQILSAMADTTILVLRAQSSTRQEARYARDRLLSVGGSVLGVVVNDVRERQGRYYSYGVYGGALAHAKGAADVRLLAAAGHQGPSMVAVRDAGGTNS